MNQCGTLRELASLSKLDVNIDVLNLALGRGSYYHVQRNINEELLCFPTLMAPRLLQRLS